jgi:hypothetical protein
MGGVGATLGCWAAAIIETKPAAAIERTKNLMANDIILRVAFAFGRRLWGA